MALEVPFLSGTCEQYTGRDMPLLVSKLEIASLFPVLTLCVTHIQDILQCYVIM